jgi:hypothetical protein
MDQSVNVPELSYGSAARTNSRDAPEFSDDSWADREWEARWHQHFQTRPYWDEQSELAQRRAR